LQKAAENNLEDLIDELYAVKNAIWNIPQYRHEPDRKALLKRKDLVMLAVRKALQKVRKAEADVVKRRLWNDLRIVI
jgi:hypothetical protein